MHEIKKVITGAAGSRQRGFCSVCSASPYVLSAAAAAAQSCGSSVILEATVNQVNQYGGYSGMRPADYVRLAESVIQETDAEEGRVILGGDHLGPYPWRHESAGSAMTKAEELVKEYAEAGFTKIHIDTSMRLGDDDPEAPLTDEVIAERAVRLAKVLEAHRRPGADYALVLGSEVPVPGGAADDAGLKVTEAEKFEASYTCFKHAFARASLDTLWGEVAAFVVQPGVEFSEDSIHAYDRGEAAQLMQALKAHPSICFEGHSTDYQPGAKLVELVSDGVCILKVGPALTFHQREAFFALEHIERELLSGTGVRLSDYAEELDRAMTDNPAYWQDYYHGDERTLAYMRKYSFSDRCRYYLSAPRVAAAEGRLLRNLEAQPIPYALLSQYMPVQAKKVRDGEISSSPEALVRSRITDCLDDYFRAAAG